MSLDELDALHAAATGQRLTPSPVAFEVAATQAWPAISARLRAAEAEVERLRGLVRWFLDGDDHTHEEDCGARGNHDLDVCRNEASQCHNMCEGPHCTCDATEMRDRARAALGEP